MNPNVSNNYAKHNVSVSAQNNSVDPGSTSERRDKRFGYMMRQHLYQLSQQHRKGKKRCFGDVT